MDIIAHITHYSKERGEYQTEYRPPHTLKKCIVYNHAETAPEPFKLFAIGGTVKDGFSSNWDIYADPTTGTLYSIARPESGAGGTYFGHCDHVRNLMRQGSFSDTLTEYGKELMINSGYKKEVQEYA